MSVFKITLATSRLTNSSGVHAFDSDTPGPDTLIVDPGAFLITQGVVSIGAWLKNTGAWTVAVNGSIVADQYSGIALDPGNSATSKITVGGTGEVGGETGMTIGSSAIIKNAGVIRGTAFEGISFFGSGTTTISNSGTISGFDGISFFGSGTTTISNSGTISGVSLSINDPSGLSNHNVTNSGTLNGSVLLAGVNALTNSGTINGDLNFDNGADTIINSKSITQSVFLGGGTNKLTNSGTIGINLAGYSITGLFDADTIVNSGSLAGGVTLGDGTNKLTNSGTIGKELGGFSFEGGSGADIIINSKSIVGSVGLAGGTNKLTNSGTIGGTVLCGSENDTIINTKSITNGVALGHGTNTLTNSGTIGSSVIGGDDADVIINFIKVGTVIKSGTISGGGIFLGGGDDTFKGGKFAELVGDSDGSDTVKLGGGNDVYRATGAAADGTDTVDGGAGIDTYDVSIAGTGGSVLINLDTIAHDLSPLFPGAVPVAAKTATGADVAGAFKDTITGFENAKGGTLNDFIHGSGVVNTLDGGNDNDFLFGYAGNDTLLGGAGADTLIGGRGKDVLTGGSEADLFYFLSIKDSGITAATRDVIVDFQSGVVGEAIDLSFIDANTEVTGDQAFNFVGTNIQTGFSGAAGELHARWTANGQILEGDVNGDKKADFSIEIIDPTHAITLVGGDFFL